MTGVEALTNATTTLAILVIVKRLYQNNIGSGAAVSYCMDVLLMVVVVFIYKNYGRDRSGLRREHEEELFGQPPEIREH